jgi:hypothetical protein
LRYAAERRTSSQRAERWRAGIQCCTLLRDVVSIQRNRRVNVGGDIGDSNRWRGRRTVRIALYVHGRCDAGTAFGLEPALTVRPSGIRAGGGRHASGGRGQRALRGIQWLPKHGEGRLRPEPDPAAPTSWGGARASRRGGGAAGAWRKPRRTCGTELVSGSYRRRELGHSGRFRSRQRQRREAVRLVAAKGASLESRRRGVVTCFVTRARARRDLRRW